MSVSSVFPVRNKSNDPYHRILHNPGVLGDALDFRLTDLSVEPLRRSSFLATSLLKKMNQTVRRFLFRSLTLVLFSVYFMASLVAGRVR